MNRDYGSFATYEIGRVLVAGGGDITEDGKTRVPTKTAKIVDVRGGTPTVSNTGSMSVGRRQHNLTVLADGSVLATGGQSRSIDELTDLDNPVFAAERWIPATNTWTVLSSARPRTPVPLQRNTAAGRPGAHRRRRLRLV